MSNPYLKAYHSSNQQSWRGLEGRFSLTEKYAWAIPTEEAVELIVKNCNSKSFVEIGAGSGYWAKMLDEAGLNVKAYDPLDRDYKFTRNWFKVERRTHKVLNEYMPNTYDMMMCWPPMDSWTAEAIKLFKGNTFIYVGEWWGGCNAVDEFFEYLEENFTELKHGVHIPQWWGIHDTIHIFRPIPHRCG